MQIWRQQALRQHKITLSSGLSLKVFNLITKKGRYQRQNLGEGSSPFKSEDPKYTMKLYWDKEHTTNGGLLWNLSTKKEQRYNKERLTYIMKVTD